MHMTRLLSALVLVAGIAACGQKGPLFLPGEPDQVRSEVPSAEGPAADAGPQQADDREDDDQR